MAHKAVTDKARFFIEDGHILVPRTTVAMSLKQALNAGDYLIPGISETDSSFGSLTASESQLSELPNSQNKTLNYDGPLRLPA